MELNFHDRINKQLIYRFELAAVVARRITKPQRKFFRFESRWLLFFYSFFFGWLEEADFIILFMSYFFLFIYFFIIFLLFFYYFFYFFIPLTCIRHIYKTSVTTQTTVNSEIFANSYSDPCPPLTSTLGWQNNIYLGYIWIYIITINMPIAFAVNTKYETLTKLHR